MILWYNQVARNLTSLIETGGKYMKKVIASIMFFIFAFLLCIPSSINVVHADTGPKPDMEIIILNLEQSDYIVAYGTKYDTYMGPHHAFIPGDKDFGKTSYGDVNDLIVVYDNVTLPEGWYLCDISSSYSNTTDLLIKSGYMWPSEFILIIYDELNSKYYLSEETKTYAFHSYFEYDMNNYNKEQITLEEKITLKKSYNYTKEIFGFFIRLILTLAIEMLLALAFKFSKKSLLIILITNVITQVGLNIGLNLSMHFNGKSPWIIFIYALIEIFILVIEATIYKILCRRGKDETRKWIITYALIANVLSFSYGILLWYLI